MVSVDLMGITAESSRKTLSPRRKWGMLVVLSLALAIIILDTTILNVALSYIIRDLQTDIQKLQWVITAYSLTLAALTITGGRLGDLFGRKRMFIAGAVLFAAGSFIASISTNVGMLVAGEAIIEGIGAALMMPATASLLVVNFQGRERAIAFGIWGGIAGAAAALGPILGGYLATNYDWRWGFRINLFVVLALLIGSVLIPESRDTKEKKELDILGVLLSAVGMLSLVFGIIESSTYGWWKAKAVFTAFGQSFPMFLDLSIVPFCVVFGLIVLVIFALWELHREQLGHTPLVSMKIFKNAQFTAGVSTTAVMSLGQTGLIFALPVFLQSVRGFDAFQTGLALLPMSLALLVVAPLSAVLGKKISGKFLISLGLLINVGAYIVLHQTLGVNTTSTDLILGLALFGIGMGLVMSQINNLTLSAVPLHRAGEASGINNTLRQVGATLGSAVIGTVLIGALGSHLVDGVYASQVIPSEMKPKIAEAVQSQTSNVEFGGGAKVNGSLPQPIQEEMTRIGHEATVEANKQSLAYGAGFALLGFFVSLFLPSAKKKEEQEAIQSLQVTSVPSQASKRIELDTALIAELILADQANRAKGKPSLGTDIRLVIDAAQNNEELAQSVNPRLAQARVLWSAGFGSKVGVKDFHEYVQGLPAVPVELMEFDARYPRLILVDARVTPVEAFSLLGIQPKDQHTLDQADVKKKGSAYWMRCQEGERYRGKSVKEVESLIEATETGLTITEGLALMAQYPELLSSHFTDLAKSGHAYSENSAACLGQWEGKAELRWRWRDHADPRCQTATRKK